MPTRPSPFFDIYFGGQPWRRTCGNSWLPVNSMLEARHSTRCLQDSHSPYLLPGDPGLTLPWTLSQVFLRPMGTVIVNRFSKTVHFIAQPNLPTTLETSSILVNQVFRLHRIPTNIVSHRGGNFLHRFGELLPRPGSIRQLFFRLSPPSPLVRLKGPTKTRSLHCVATSNPFSWSQHLPWVA